jgi:hypothetical protein
VKIIRWDSGFATGRVWDGCRGGGGSDLRSSYKNGDGVTA